MSVIGVYDSGVGGLTTLCALKRVLTGNDFFYLADNKNSPYGTKTTEEIFSSVENSLKILRDNCDHVVIACNTASTVVKPSDAFLLHPNLDFFNPKSTLVLTTPATKKALDLDRLGFVSADTKKLATLVEIMASISYKSKGEINLNIPEKIVTETVENAVKNCGEITDVFLGCSHYLFLKPIIKKCLKSARIFDGNDALLSEILAVAKPKNGVSKITFNFTGGNESDKYFWLLENLENNRTFFGV